MDRMDKIVESFNAPPFLFIGSGLSRRYYNLPDWETLLRHFISIVDNDDFAFAKYEALASDYKNQFGKFPKMAEFIERDFNNVWFSGGIERLKNQNTLESIKSKGLLPFKAEIAEYIKCNSVINEVYSNEIKQFNELSNKSISGIITTNYDDFIETHTNGYTVFVGQEQLLFSPTMELSEIYKIHGCVSNPQSIVINEQDYISYANKSKYLAAKLMTIFLEYPIFFIGYSLNDSNIQSLLSDIVDCLSDVNLRRLQNRLFFVSYEDKITDSIDIGNTFFTFQNGKTMSMTKISTGNFELLYTYLLKSKYKYPVKFLRKIKNIIYEFALNEQSGSILSVADIDDKRIDDEDFAIAIGQKRDIAVLGLRGIKSSDWFRDILLDDIGMPVDDLLEITYPDIIKQAQKLPLNKYLSKTQKEHVDLRKIANAETLKSIKSSQVVKSSQFPLSDRSVSGIWNKKGVTDDWKFRYIAYLEEKEIDTDELKELLCSLFEKNKNLLEPDNFTYSQNTKTHIRRLIRIYDFLVYNKKRTSSK